MKLSIASLSCVSRPRTSFQSTPTRGPKAGGSAADPKPRYAAKLIDLGDDDDSPTLMRTQRVLSAAVLRA
jgi:hypothetical protein